MADHRVGRVGTGGDVSWTRRWHWLGMGMQNGARESTGECGGRDFLIKKKIFF